MVQLNQAEDDARSDKGKRDTCQTVPLLSLNAEIAFKIGGVIRHVKRKVIRNKKRLLKQKRW